MKARTDFAIRECTRCGVPYDWRRSSSASLRMTYCGTLCESADLGYTIEGLLQVHRAPARIITFSPPTTPTAA